MARRFATLGVALILPFVAHADSAVMTYDLPGNLTTIQPGMAAAPAIVTPPVAMAAEPGGTASFSVSVQSITPVTYQWRFNGNDIQGQTGDSLFIPSVSLAHEGSYTVVVTNGQSSVESAPATLSFADPPELIAWGDNTVNQNAVPPGLIHVVAMAAGGQHSLALKSDGTVVAWGSNTNGASTVPGGLSDVTAISAGDLFSLALKSDGTVVAWGLNSSGQTTLPGGLTNVTAVAAGVAHGLALKSDGTVVGWGDNTHGQAAVPAGLKNVTAISAGLRHSLALISDGTVVAWGGNTEPYNSAPSNQTVVPAGLQNVIAISAGAVHNVALKADGTVVAWGGNSFIAAIFARQSVVPAGLSGVVAISAGAYHTLALKSDGTVVGWGENSFGQSIIPPATASGVVAIAAGGSCSLELLGTESRVSKPVLLTPGFINVGSDSVLSYLVPTKNHATSFSATGLPAGLSIHPGTGVIMGTPTATGTFVVTLSATNAAGTSQSTITFHVSPSTPGITSLAAQALAGASLSLPLTASNSPTSFSATGLPAGLTLAAGTGLITGSTAAMGTHVISVTATNAFGTGPAQNYSLSIQQIIGFGDNDFGQIVIPPTLGDAVAVAQGGFHLLVLKADGTVTVIGGTSGSQASDIPPGLTGVVAIAAGYYHNVALKADGTVVTWGNNWHLEPQPPGLTSVVAIAAGASHVLAVKADGTVAAWGHNGRRQCDVPAGLGGVVAVTAGDDFSVALKANGTVEAWGENPQGTQPNTAIQVGVPAGLNQVVAIESGGDHTVALKSDGTVKGWGIGTSGQLSFLIGLNGVAEMAGGGRHTVLLKTDGTVQGVGRNTEAQIVFTAGHNHVFAVAAGGDNSSLLASVNTSTALPVVYAPPFARAVTGFPFQFRVKAQNAPTSYAATGLPAGLSIHASTGLISGTPTVGGTFPIILSATNGSGTATRALTLYVQAPAPNLVVQVPVGTDVYSGGTADVGGAVPTQSVSRVFTIKNTGLLPLNNFSFSFSGAQMTEFAVSVNPAASVAVNGTTTFTVKCTPAAAGTRNAVLHIASNDLSQNPYDINLTGTGVTTPGFFNHPGSRVAALGSSTNFFVSASGGGLSYQWLKNNVAIAGATSPSYTLSSLALTHAAAYSCKVTNAAGSATSVVANLGIVNTAASAVGAVAGGTLSLTIPAAAPGITYQWKKNGTNLTNGSNPVNAPGVISGATSAKLSITKAVAADVGSYTCVVSTPFPLPPPTPPIVASLSSGPVSVTLAVKPVLDPFTPSTWIVAGTIADQVTAQNLPTAFTVKGLPKGVTIDATGHFQGRPAVSIAVPTVYHLTITASNAAGACLVPLQVDVTVQPLQSSVVGTFNGLIDRDTTLSAPVTTPAGLKLQGHGGSLSNLVVGGTGVITGSVKLEDKSYTIPPTSQLTAGINTNATASVILVRGTPTDVIADLTFAFTIDKDSGQLTGTITDGLAGSTPVPVLAWRNPWKTTGTTASPPNPATALAGIYTARLALDPALSGYNVRPDIPQGCGYVILSVTKAGTATWGGRLADGSSITGGTTLSATGQIPFHLLLYTLNAPTTAGSAHGWVAATPDSVGTPLNAGRPLLDGTLDWEKLPQLPTSTTRSYKGGFALHNLTVVGGGYAAPPANTPVIGLTDSPQNNAKLTFSEADLASSALAGPGSPAGSTPGTLNQSLRVTKTNTVAMPPASGNPGAVTLTLAAGTGLISGSFTLKDNDPTDTSAPFAVVARNTPWQGVLVPRLNKGYGHFQLARLPAIGPPKTTPTTSPQLSGQVILQAAP